MGGRKCHKNKLIVLSVVVINTLIINLLIFTPVFEHQKQSHIHNNNEKRSLIPNNVVIQKVRNRFKYHMCDKNICIMIRIMASKGAVTEQKCI